MKWFCTAEVVATIITARIRRMTEDYVFTLSTMEGGYPHPVSGDYPHPVLMGVYPHPVSTVGVPHPSQYGAPPPPHEDRIGLPPSRTQPGYQSPHWDWLGYSSPLPSIQNSTASTRYMAGGMPLAFTQEDFLVFIFSNTNVFGFYFHYEHVTFDINQTRLRQ